MANNLSQRAPGTAPIAENGLEKNEFASIDDLNRAFIDRMARGAYARWKNLVGSTEAQILGAIDVKETAYRNAFKKFWEDKGMSVDDMAMAGAWKKARKAAVERYREFTQNTPSEGTPAVPEKPAPPPVVASPAPEPEEIPVAIEIPPIPAEMEIQNWYEWNNQKLDSESLSKFSAAFVWKLNSVVDKLSGDPQLRAAQFDELRGIYASVTFRMYQNLNSGYSIDALREEFEGMLPAYWESILEAVRLHSPIS